ncbi:MAG: hypothetical protein ACXWBL_02060 [Usitatibacter sp.]
MVPRNNFAPSRENKSVVAAQHARYLAMRQAVRGLAFPGEGPMDRNNARYTESLEERIHAAKAERSVAVGYAIGDALDALWRVIASLPFAPGARRRGKLIRT